MTRLTRPSVALLLGVALGAFVLTASSCDRTDQAAAMDSGQALARLRTPVTARVTSTQTAYFRVAFPPTTDTFTIMLTDTLRIREARDIVRGVQTDATRVMGTIIKAPAPYNPSWGYHLDPASISFFEFAVEVCDAAPRYVEQHLSEVGGAFLPGSVWCPWSSRVVEEVHVHCALLPIVLSAAPTPYCRPGDASLSLSASSTTLEPGQPVTVMVTLVNGIGDVRLGLIQYTLSVQPDDALMSDALGPVEHALTLEPGQSDAAAFVLRATAPGPATVTAWASFEIHPLDNAWGSWSGCQSLPLEIKVLPRDA